MNDSERIIKKTKKKFLVFTFVGVALIATLSISALFLHVKNVERQNTTHSIYTLINSQLDLLNKISLLSERYDDNVKVDLINKTNDEIKSLLKAITSSNIELKRILVSSDSDVSQEVRNVFKENQVSYQLELFEKTANDLLESNTLVAKDVKINIQYLSFSSRDGLGNILKVISKRLQNKLKKSLDIYYYMGFALVAFCVIQFFLTWGLVFRPLYSTVLEQHQKIIDAIFKAESASRSKTEFLASISHEIRTPMTAILGYADVLKRDSSDPEGKDDAVRIIDHNAHHLLALIDEILDLSKIEAGKFDYDNRRIDLEAFLNEVYSLINVKSQDKGVELIFTNNGEIPDQISCDPKRLKQVLYNLLGNAIKFTEKGFVELTVSYDKKDELLSFKIKDTGVGIGEDQKEKLFKPFSQGDTSVTRKFGGTGLGLVLSREIARGMGGDVSIVSSQKGVGTIMEATLDVGKSDKLDMVSDFSTNIIQDSDSAEVVIDETKLLNTKILVVDDAKENARLFKMYLTEAGADVTIANDGIQALEAANSQFFDVVLLDLQMPGKDGFQVIKELKESAFDKPVIALTAHAMAEEKAKTSQAGFSDHVTKPVKPNVLIGSVVKSLRGRSVL